MTKRKYEETHQWLTFSGDAMQRAKPELWMMLGECQSKCEHLSKYPLRPDVAENIHRMYMAKGVLATTAIEGNTLSEKEVRKLLDGELELPPSREYLAQEVQNIVDECNRILTTASARKEVALTTKRIQEINKTVLAKLQLEAHVQPGVIRNYEVGVGLYKAAPPDECEMLLDKMCQWLGDPKYFGTDSDPRVMVYGIIKAILAHLYLAWIHPFGDGNGRTARLIEFQILIAARVPSPAAHLLSNHYYRTRSDYYKQLHLASVAGGDVLPFITYAVQGFLDGLREQIEEVKKQVIDVVWSKYVAERFTDKTSPANQRRHALVEELSKLIEPRAVSYEQIPIITPRATKLYSKLSPRTLVRDLNQLYKMRLIQFENGLVRARKEVINAFLPVQAQVPAAQPPRRTKGKSNRKAADLSAV
jgi:Fic family protein